MLRWNLCIDIHENDLPVYERLVDRSLCYAACPRWLLCDCPRSMAIDPLFFD